MNEHRCLHHSAPPACLPACVPSWSENMIITLTGGNYASFLEYLHKQTANSVYAKYYNYTFTLTRFTPGVEWWLHLAPRTSHLAPSTARCLCAKNDTLRSATVTTTRGGRWLHLPPASPLTFKHSTPPVSSDALTFCVASSPRGQPLT